MNDRVGTRTQDRLIKSQVLYQTELRDRETTHSTQTKTFLGGVLSVIPSSYS